MLKKVLFIIIFILLVLSVWADKKAVLDELSRPSAIHIDMGRIYIVDFPHVYIYSGEDLSFIKSFGSAGAGPAEFLRYARLHFHADYIIVQSSTRFSYFSREGKYIREEKVPVHFDRGVKLFGRKLVVSRRNPGKENEQELNLTVNFYNFDFQKEKEIFRQKYFIQLNDRVNAIYLPEVDRRASIRFFVNQDKIFIEGENGETGNIYVFDQNGEKLYTINHTFEKLKVSGKHIEAVEEWHRIKKRRLYPILKERNQLYTPPYFAAIHYLRLADNKIYIIPYKKKAGKNQLYIFDLKGELLNRVPAPLVEENLFNFYPHTIKNGKLYQLLDNDEEWELRISKIQQPNQS